MINQPLSFDAVIDLAMQLTRIERARLIAQIAPTLVEETPTHSSKRSSYGILADLNVDLSAEDIDEARREAWANFPREDIN